MRPRNDRTNATWLMFFISLLVHAIAEGHDQTKPAALRLVAQAQVQAESLRDPRALKLDDMTSCRLQLNLLDAATRRPVPGLVRVTMVDSGKHVPLAGEVHRAGNWFSLAEGTKVRVPRHRLKIEALHGLETELVTREIDTTDRATAEVELPLVRFVNSAERGLRSGNTHLHLMKLTFAEMDHYLRTVPRSDGLDLVFVSYLSRVPDDRDYISNTLTDGDLKRLSQSGVLFGNGEEHRHNFGAGGQGFGHVMLLNIQKLIQPVSIGPGIMRSGTDGIPLQRGIRTARADGAAVIWCHNRFGWEDVPNWLAELIDAQNIHDGGAHGSYEDTFYRYLNLGMRVPFSTGTDWFMYDFSRVYVPLAGELTVPRWLDQLVAGRSTITNGPLLELCMNGRGPGDVIDLSAVGAVEAVGTASGRLDFGGLELVHNGLVVAKAASQQHGGHFTCELKHAVKIDEPGWLALRIPLDAGKNELGQAQFAHTSAVECRLSSRRIFRRDVAEGLLDEMRAAISAIGEQGKFADDTERNAVLDVYRAGIKTLQARIEAESP